MNYDRERNRYTERLSDADVCTADAGHIEEVGALLLGGSPYAWRRGLPHGRGSLQSVTSEYPYTSRLSGQRNDCLLQNRRQDTLQAKRHTSHARKELLPNTQEGRLTKRVARSHNLSQGYGQE